MHFRSRYISPGRARYYVRMDGEELKAWRRLHGISAQELADHVGIPHTRYANWEKGRSNVPLDVQAVLRQAMREIDEFPPLIKLRSFSTQTLERELQRRATRGDR